MSGIDNFVFCHQCIGLSYWDTDKVNTFQSFQIIWLFDNVCSTSGQTQKTIAVECGSAKASQNYTQLTHFPCLLTSDIWQMDSWVALVLVIFEDICSVENIALVNLFNSRLFDASTIFEK